MSIRSQFPDLPPVWAAGFMLAEWVAARMVPLVEFDAPATGLAAILFVAAGLALMVWSALWFRRKRTAIEPGEIPSALIVEGPFRVNRNPIYTGMALALLGVALWLGALSAVIVAALFPWLITRRFVLKEEAGLRQAFGPEADRYFARTRRW